MKRRLLLVEGNQADQQWVTDQLKSRFRSLTLTCVQSLDDAHRAIIDYGCDILVTSLKLSDGESPAAIIHALRAFAPGVPIIALTDLVREDESILDVITIGVSHVLYKEDLQKDYSKLTSVIVDTVRSLVTSDTNRDNVNERVTAMAQKVWDIDMRTSQAVGDMKQRQNNTDVVLAALTTSIGELTKVIDKRGGLEDRVKELEVSRAFAIKVLIGAAGAIGTILAAVGTAIVGLYKK